MNPLTSDDLQRRGMVTEELLGQGISEEVKDKVMGSLERHDMPGRTRQGLSRLTLCERAFRWNMPLSEKEVEQW